MKSGVQSLEYASGPALGPSDRRRASFIGWMIAFAVSGIVANATMLVLLVQSAHQTSSVYQALKQNPSAWGRRIDPQVIELLRNPISLWLSEAFAALALGVGLLLALHLLSGALRLLKGALGGVEALKQYVRWKMLGLTLTVLALLWLNNEQQTFWSTATRHISIGSGPPILEMMILAFCGTAPWHYVQRSVRAYAS